MNKRFFVALLLTMVVVMLTPMLFRRAPGVPAPIAADSAVAGKAAIDTPPGAVSAPARLPGAPAPAERPAAPGLATSAAAETTVVATAKAHIRLSSLGGSLIGARLTDFRSLGTDSGAVELARPGESLLRFRVVAGRDTLALDNTPLHREGRPDANEVAYNGTIGNVGVTVRWNFAPDTFRVKIAGVEQPIGYLVHLDIATTGLAPGAFLLVDLPPGFRSSEADSTTDFTHLAYAYKRASGGSDLVRFGKLAPGERAVKPGPLSWAVAKSKYFLVGVLPSNAASPFAELQLTGMPKTSRIATTGQATVIVPMRDGAVSLDAYIGPQEFRRLIAMGREFETANPYGGWMQGMIQPFSTIIMRLLLWMRDFLHLPYGWTLIAFGVFIRVVLWPLNQMAMRSSLRMQRVQPELAAAQKKYASNPEKQRDEIMRIYREHGMSPFSALSGCLPMLIPMPVLFALFFVFQNTIEFRGVPFLWMTDISQYDPLFILPIAMGASMFVLSWLGVRNAPPNPQSKMMMYFLPAMMMFFLFKFAAGLNLYYAAQNLAAIPQQWLIANERAKITPRSG